MRPSLAHSWLYCQGPQRRRAQPHSFRDPPPRERVGHWNHRTFLGRGGARIEMHAVTGQKLPGAERAFLLGLYYLILILYLYLVVRDVCERSRTYRTRSPRSRTLREQSFPEFSGTWRVGLLGGSGCRFRPAPPSKGFLGARFNACEQARTPPNAA